MITTDPADERFDLVNEDGSPTSVTKSRADVHRDGDWHRAFHLWLVWRQPDGEERVLFQRRSLTKDTWPGRLDVAVGGHFRAGEDLGQVVREVEEELGLAVGLDRLIPVGIRRIISHTDEWYDRELQAVHVLPLPDGLPPLRPNPTELAAVCQIAVAALVRLFENGELSVDALIADVRQDGSLSDWRTISITVDDFIPVRDSYWLNGTRTAARLLPNG